MMRVLFRADSGNMIGAGHVMRSLCLAEELKRLGAECLFASREHEGALTRSVIDRGFDLASLPLGRLPTSNHGKLTTGYQHWLGAHWQNDARETAKIAEGFSADWIIADHYGIERRWLTTVRDSTKYIAVIDDLADRELDCDLLVDQNLGRILDDYIALTPEHCTILTGTRYALLRPEFAKKREACLAQRGSRSCRHILVMMGASDPDDYTSRVLDQLDRCDLPADTRVTAILGPTAPHIPEVQRKLAELQIAGRLLVAPADISKIMACADLAIGAPGSAAWERCCMGLPSIVIPIAANQLHNAKALARHGAAKLASLERPQEFRSTIVNFCRDHTTRIECSRAAARLVDGRGCARVAESLAEVTRSKSRPNSI